MWDMALFIIVVTGGLTYLFVYSFKKEPAYWITAAVYIAMIAIPGNIALFAIENANTVEEANVWVFFLFLSVIIACIAGWRWATKAEPKVKQRLEERKKQKELEQQESTEHKDQ